ncbi:hypothetical protein K469DRAFT_743187 [Zopfia rhizophila CBS 207.26]|uniref:Alpha-ketoglutarate-dependent dioxygenase AlkB-like domain-containing protein n=1 Tax=Zopfia rhizophila CBS 207.26 TaxID=1314779 RepID=A0A6A6D8D7_9PEZI|nr:hypothetical protein K469DRAFT_743187 [Zopfia rhizophila CBS 207.26]
MEAWGSFQDQTARSWESQALITEAAGHEGRQLVRRLPLTVPVPLGHNLPSSIPFLARQTIPLTSFSPVEAYFRKRDSLDYQEIIESSIFDPPYTSLDAPDSPLSSVPDDISQCSEAREDKRIKREVISEPEVAKELEGHENADLVENQPLEHTDPQDTVQEIPFGPALLDEARLYTLASDLIPVLGTASSKLEPSNRPIGFMFDGASHPHDYLDANVVTARAGGGKSKNEITGNRILNKDQEEGSQGFRVRNSMAHYNPVVIIGNSYPCAPSKFSHLYSLNADEPSWWMPKDVKAPVALGEPPPPVIKECIKCKHESQQAYLQGWMCRQPECNLFWRLENSNEPDEAGLLYEPRFLKQRTAWPNDNHRYSLAPNLMELRNQYVPGDDVSHAAWKGIVCPKCSRCNSRESWLGWEYRNITYDFTYLFPHTVIPPQALHDPHFPLTAGYTLSRGKHNALINITVKFAHNYRINIFEAPRIEDFVAHLVANKTVIEEENGRDDMSVELQKKDIGLRHRPLQNGQLKGDNFTQHFLVNYGMPYKFIAATASSDKHQEFNEVLALGYCERQSIDYHDDGEFGLGTMRLRMKARHSHGVSVSASRGTADERKAYKDRLKAMTKELELTTKGKANPAITMTLGHGDIVIMHGECIQRYYEHPVDHSGKLRFALTCRYIDANSPKQEDHPKYEVAADTGSYDGSKLASMG